MSISQAVRIFLMVEALMLATLLSLYLASETYFHKFLEIGFGLPSSTEGVYGSYAKERTPSTSTFHDIQSVTGDALCLVLILRALYKLPLDSSAASAALLAIFIDHGGFALACYYQWGWIQPVVQGGAMSLTALTLWYMGTSYVEKRDKKQ